MPKIALILMCALVLMGLVFAALQPRPVRAFARRCLSSHPPGRVHPNPLPTGTNNSPVVIFWAWERPEDFRFLTPGQAAVAFLAKTIYLQPPATDSSGATALSFLVRPRLQPLRIAPGTPLIAAVRIEMGAAPRVLSVAQPLAPSFRSVSYSATRSDRLASEIADLQSIPGISAIQIDFDAPASAHPFYATLLQEVRRKLPDSFPLSITALASWCIGDPWLAQLPPNTIDEAVPMLFRMGPAAGDVVKFLHSGNDFPVAACQFSLGLSTDEPLLKNLLSSKSLPNAVTRHDKRVYVFAPRSWSQSDADEILKELHP